jgi:signal transduction histidine kinase/ActR/RegA family two-component response regulator
MAGQDDTLFGDAAWRPALEKYAEVTRLTVVVYGVGEKIVSGPIHPTPLFQLFQERGYEPGIFADCARRCLAQIAERPAVVVAPSYGLAVVGTSLVLEGRIVGAAVAGYAFLDFSQASAVERLARDAGVAFSEIWSVARTTQPVPERRLVVHGELLQVLGDTILRENYRTRQLAVAAADKDKFLAVISHELRTPLSPILLWTELLRRDPTRLTRALDVIERNARLEARMVEDLVELSRTTHGPIAVNLQARDLRGEIGSAVASVLELATEKSIDVRFEEGDEPLPVDVDPDRLHQVFRNILGNALKFTPAGGSIAVSLARDGEHATVTIQDTGHGITPEFLPFVFDMFRQEAEGPERRRGGLGIGLALVKRLVELHGGEIAVTSAGTGHGTTVAIRLPLVQAPPALVAPPSTAAAADSSATPLAGLRILVVEDSEDIREAITAMLEELGAQVRGASDGVEGLEAVRNHRPDVVLCDLVMPVMDGFEFIKRVHAAAADQRPPVIAITGLGSAANRQRTRRAGFHARLDKPFARRDLVVAIKTAVAQPPNP